MRRILQFFSLCESSNLIDRLNKAEKEPVLFIAGQKDCRFENLMNEVIKKLEEDRENEKLLQRLTALRYRLEGVNGGLDSSLPTQDDREYLYFEAIQWKRMHPLIGKPILSAKERIHIKKVGEYSEFVQLLKKFSSLKEKFLKWVLQDGNDVVPFIEFPATCEKIIQANLSGRINREQASLRILKEVKGAGKIKILCMPFQGKFISILDDEKKVIFKGHYVLTIREIFSIFSKKEFEVGNLEFMRDGIVNWNIHRLGYWDADLNKHIEIDINKEKWWEEMPPLEIINRRQVVKRYGKDIKLHGWIASAVATRGNADLDFDATHAFLEVAIPNEDGTYSIYDFGKLATEYPSNLLEKLMMLTKTVHAAVAYPDDNIFYTTRQKGFESFVLNSRQGYHLMNLIRNDIRTAKKNNFVYQIESENCAKWVHSLLEKVVNNQMPDLFRMQLLDTQPKGVVSNIFSWIKKLPSNWQVPVLTFLHLPLGAHRTVWVEEGGQKVAKSLSRHSFFETGQIFLPALLIHKIIKNENNFVYRVFDKFKRKLKIQNLKLRFYFERRAKLILRQHDSQYSAIL